MSSGRDEPGDPRRGRATRLAELRQLAGITQRELARRLDVTQNYIPALETGTRQADPKLRRPLCDLLLCDFWDVFDVVLVDVVLVDDRSRRAVVLVPVEE